MKEFGNLVIGTLGTSVAALSPEQITAIFAGSATGIWMLTQVFIAIRREFRPPPPPPPSNEK